MAAPRQIREPLWHGTVGGRGGHAHGGPAHRDGAQTGQRRPVLAPAAAATLRQLLGPGRGGGRGGGGGDEAGGGMREVADG